MDFNRATLHSTMFLLIRLPGTNLSRIALPLHSTMFLLIQCMNIEDSARKILYIPQCFY